MLHLTIDFIGNKKSHAKPQSSQSFSKEYPEKLGFLVEISWRSWRLCEKRIISDNVYLSCWVQSRYAASMLEFPRLLRRGVYPEFVEGLLAMT
jgi:hypothetical protein